jgi:hypothetical protein
MEPNVEKSSVILFVYEVILESCDECEGHLSLAHFTTEAAALAFMMNNLDDDTLEESGMRVRKVAVWDF